jgi:DTW domain-containing protein
VGEASAWPYRSREPGVAYEDELVHWVAHRLATGEVFESVIAPRGPLAPRAASHVRLTEAALLGGTTIEAFRASWRTFLRDRDVVCSWGRYATRLFSHSGGFLPDARVDLRQVARSFARGKVGTLEEFVASLGAGPVTPMLPGASPPGRAGVRLGELSRVATCFARAGHHAETLATA